MSLKSNIKIYHYNKKITNDMFVFSAGEIQVKLKFPFHKVDKNEPFDIRAYIFDAKGIVELLMISDALYRAHPETPQHLILPYLPYSRQDRVCADGEAFGLDVMLRMLALAHFTTITTYDAHSAVALNSFLAIKNVTAEHFVSKIAGVEKFTHIVAPDKGGYERAERCADLLGIPMLIGKKKRDPNTGEITGTSVHLDNAAMDSVGYLGDSKLLIVDDIIDGGRTFIELAKVINPLLSEKGRLELFATHGIFSKGRKIVEEHFDYIYVANDFELNYSN